MLDTLNETELLARVDELELELYSNRFNTFLDAQEVCDRAKLGEMRSALSSLRARLQTAELADLAARLVELGPQLKTGIDELQQRTRQMDSFIQTTAVLANVIGIVGKLVC